MESEPLCFDDFFFLGGLMGLEESESEKMAGGGARTSSSSLLFLLPSEANFVRDLESEGITLAEMTVEQVLQKLFRNADPSPK